jgi:hypothetical protein
MSLTKYAALEDAQVLGVKGSEGRVRTASLDKFADFHDYRTEDGYLYARIRAISSRVNKNHDGWPSVELAGGQEIFDKYAGQHRTAAFTVEADQNHEYGYSTFLGKPIFVDHHNSDPERARGVIVDAKLHVEDGKTASTLDPYYASAPDNHMPPTWVELLLEVDATSFPRLAKAIIDGKTDSSQGIDGFSMGCDVEKSVCNICKNAAHAPDEYCEHVKMKGAHFDYTDPDTGRKTSRKAYEDCYGVKFFEISAVFDPADETALIRDVVHKEGKVAAGPFDQDLGGNPVECNNCGSTGVLGNPCAGCGQPLEEIQETQIPEYHPPSQIPVPGPEEEEYEALKFRNQIDQTFPTFEGKTAGPITGVPGHDQQLQQPYQQAQGDGFQCPDCGSTVEQIGEAGECAVCGWSTPSVYDSFSDGYTAKRKVAENPLPQSDLLHAPEEIDTLREETI